MVYTLTINRDNNNDITSYQVAIDDTSLLLWYRQETVRITSEVRNQIT